MAKSKRLVLLQKADLPALKIHNLTNDSPENGTFGIISQSREAPFYGQTCTVEDFGLRIEHPE
jgi:hypothetical protein